MKKPPRPLLPLLFALCLLVAAQSPAFAAKPDKVRITSVADLNLGNWPSASMSGNNAACVYNSADTSYHVTATDNSTIKPSGFYLQNAGATAKILYSLYWGNSSSPGAIPMGDGVRISATGAATASQSCNGGTNANYKVTINNSDLAAVPAGTYTATITLSVEP